jgi:Tol biopolymer transport system component
VEEGAVRTRWAALLVLVFTTAACGGAGAGSTAPSASAATAGRSQAPGVPVAAGESWIVYQWVAGSGDGVFLVRGDGTGLHQLLPDLVGSEIHPDWSPDGERIAFVRQAPEGHTELWVVNADGTDGEAIYTCEQPCNEIHYPDWSPDGASIIVSQSANAPVGGGIPEQFSFERVDAATGEATTVYVRDDSVETWQGRLSPDGDLLAYTVGIEGQGTAVFTSPVAGGPEAQLTEWEMMAAHPDWTEDGRIVFHTHDLGLFQTASEPADLYLMDADGGNVEQLTMFTETGKRAAQSRVAPDGSGVTFTWVGGPGAARQIAFLEFGDTVPRAITGEPIQGTHPSLRPVP